MIYDSVIAEVKKLLAALQKDDIGTPVGQEFVGGGGGLLSVETIHQANLVRLALNTAERPTHLHLKRESKYRLVGYAHVQSDRWVEHTNRGLSGDYASVDMRLVAVYEAVDESNPEMRLWVRPVEEFGDTDRFTVL